MTSLDKSNPLLAGWQLAYGPDAPFNTYKRGFAFENFEIRRRLCATYSFAVPTDEALDAIAKLGPVVEIGAGTGYWARLLRDRGVDVLAYDSLGKEHRKWFPHGCLDEVRRGGVAKAARHADRTLLLVWPPMSSMAHDAAKAYHAVGGQHLVYVGELGGGCTADDQFFAHLDEAWSPLRWVELPQWDGIHDVMAIYERRG